MIFQPYLSCSLKWRGRRKRTHKETKKKYLEETNNKQTSIKIKLELSQWHPATSSSPFPVYIWRITFTPLLQLTQHFQNTVCLGWSVCSVRCTEQPQNCSPCFETSVKHLSLCYVGLQGSKVYLWAAEQQCIKLLDSDGFAGSVCAKCITMLWYFTSDLYCPALGYRQGTKSCFVLSSICINWRRTIW